MKSSHTAANTPFSELGVHADTVSALEKIGITHAFAIQELTLPIALAGDDVIGQARTGTGKTLGFGIPLLERIRSATEGASGTPQALVVVPTRELCVQVARDIEAAGAVRAIRVAPIYGGRSYDSQREALRIGVDVVVGTPGRLLDLAEQGVLHLKDVAVLVLDEADEMLDLGFLPAIEQILTLVPTERQTMLFSATMPDAIIGLARKFMQKPVHIRAEDPTDEQTVPATTQFVYQTHSLNKIEILARLLQAEERGLAMVFCRTKRGAQRVANDLEERGFAAASVHGDLRQEVREKALRAFRNQRVNVLVATDVAARGIDINGVTHVVNYDCPEDEKTYVHRIGRTGRAGAAGVAVTFVDWEELSRWELINKLLDLNFSQPVETYHTSPHLAADLKIPSHATERLSRPAVKRQDQRPPAADASAESPRVRRRTRRSGKTALPKPAEKEKAAAIPSPVGLMPVFSEQ